MPPEATDPSPEVVTAAVVDALTRILAHTCRELGKAGHPSTAAQLAAEAWSLLREDYPNDAERLNGAMHYLSRLEQKLEAEQRQAQSEAAMHAQDRIIDVRSETPKMRHEIIFEQFAALAPGTAYVLVNDHDPKPLWYQFDAEHKGEFTWDALEDGPEVWRVRIGRTAKR
ncbi:MAG: DUF2249 domain-containing protein [Gemmatimonadaceae bacterium]